MRRDFSYINDASFISAFTRYYFTLLSLDRIVLRSESIVSRFYFSLKNLNSNDQILALISCCVPPSESLKADNDTWIAINLTSSVPCSQFKYRRIIVWREPGFPKPIITRKRLTMAGRNRVLFDDQWSSRNVAFVDRFSRSGASEANEIHQACNDRGSSAGIPSQFPTIAHSVSGKWRKASLRTQPALTNLTRNSCVDPAVGGSFESQCKWSFLFRIVPANDKFNRRADRTNKRGLEEEILVESVWWLFCSELQAPKDDKTERVESIVADFQLVRTHGSVWKR